MMHILLPCLGNPLQEVWLPAPGSSPDPLTIPLVTSREINRLARDHAEQCFGIEDRAIGMLGEKRLKDKTVFVWILWLQAGDAPRNLQCMTVAKATAHPEFGKAVVAFKEHLARRS